MNISSVDRYLLQRQVLTNRIIAETDETAMRRIIDGPFKQVELDIVAEAEDYQKNFPSDPATVQALKSELDRLFTLWGAYVQSTQQVADLSMINSTQKAININEGLNDFWDSVDERLGTLATMMAQNKNEELQNYTTEAWIARTALAQFRTNLVAFTNSTNPATFKEQEDRLKFFIGRIDGIVKEMSEKVPANEGGSIAAGIYQDLMNTATPNFMQIVTLVNQNANGRALELFDSKAVPEQQAVAQHAAEMLRTVRAAQDEAISHTADTVRQAFIVMVVVSAIGIIVGAALAVYVISGIIRRLNGIIASLGDSSTQVNQAAAQISDSSQTLAEGSTEQAASLEETSSALEQMASMTRQNADNANKTNDTMTYTGKLFQEGSGYMTSMNESMEEISESSEKIRNIIKTIEDIAFQTNLLALNAAIEAARAGEAGKGFAVVADEVRNLAQRSAQAARDTTQLIESTVDRVKNGTEVAKALNNSFSGIQESATNVTRLVSEISAATNEQAQGVDQVNTAVAQMDKVTQSNAATAEEAASAAEELSAQSAALKNMVGDLIGMVSGRAANTNGQTPPLPSAGSRPRIQSAPKQKVMQVESFDGAGRGSYSAPSSGSGSGMKMIPASEVIPLDESDDF
ncbi:MAG: methyl-accepting chemotaxis protein [Planctomycetaceae bacterium]|nr:methyl-accepting chemotaxis protein [Planctomycetaceae bacterium]